MPEEIKRARVIFTLNVGLPIRNSTKKKWKQVGAIIELASGNLVGNIDMAPLEWIKQVISLGCVQFSIFPVDGAGKVTATIAEDETLEDPIDTEVPPF